jgi:hypothetical protein
MGHRAMSNTLDKRLAKVEEDRHTARGVAVVPKHSDESNESAVARWLADHPGAPDPRTAPLTVFITKWSREWASQGWTMPEGLTA